MFRLWFMTFFGEWRGRVTVPTLSPSTARISAMACMKAAASCSFRWPILALLATVGGLLGWPDALGGSNWLGHFLAPVFNAPHLPFEQAVVAANLGQLPAPTPVHEGSTQTEFVLMGISILAVFCRLVCRLHVCTFASPSCPAKLAKQYNFIYSLVFNKYWVDEIYTALIVRPLNVFARIVLWWTVDRGLVDGSAYAAAGTAMGLGAILRRLQSGNIRSYAGWLAGGAAASFY